MDKPFYGSTLAERVAFVTNFSAMVTLHAADLHVAPDLVTSLTSLTSEFVTSANETQQPSTRTPTAIVLRNQRWASLLPLMRSIATSINESPLVSDYLRSELGLHPRKKPSRINPPSFTPTPKVLSVIGREVAYRVADNTGKFRMPVGAAQIIVLSFTGTTPPDASGAWRLEGAVSKPEFRLSFPTTLEPGATVWTTCYYLSARGESGPACTPIPVTFGAATVENTGSLKLAA